MYLPVSRLSCIRRGGGAIQKIAAVLLAALAAAKIFAIAASCSLPPNSTCINLLKSNGPIISFYLYKMGERTDEQTINSLDFSNFLYILDTFNTLNLDNHQQILVGSTNVICVGSLEGVGSEHGTETSSTGWWVL